MKMSTLEAEIWHELNNHTEYGDDENGDSCRIIYEQQFACLTKSIAGLKNLSTPPQKINEPVSVGEKLPILLVVFYKFRSWLQSRSTPPKIDEEEIDKLDSKK